MDPKDNSISKKLVSAMIVSACGPGLSGFCLAQAGSESVQSPPRLEEVVVTAQRRQENLIDVPISVHALGANTLETAGIHSSLSLPEIAPSLQMARSGPGVSFFMRGVGNNSGSSGEESPNAFYVDGVYIYEKNMSALKFNNIERIEILKGPQGTLFGRNAAGGLINVITKEPGDTVEAKINVGYANYNTYSSQAYLASPVTETLSADIALTSTNQKEGWGKYLATGKDVSKGWDWGARTKWVWTPSDILKITASAEYGKLSNDFTNSFRIAQDSFSVLGTPPANDPYDSVSGEEGINQQTNTGGGIIADLDLNWATLTSITGYRKNKNLSSMDLDTDPAPLAFITVETTSSSLQQELRLASSATDPLSWQAGIFYLDAEVDLERQRNIGLAFGGINSGMDTFATLGTKSIAGFAEATYSITPSTRLTAGIRYTRDKQNLSSHSVRIENGDPLFNVRNSKAFSGETYRLALHHSFTDHLSVFASYNKGFKSGTFSVQAPTNAPVDPQEVDAYEIGLKSELFESRLRLNVSAYYYEISDYQTRAGSDTSASGVLINAAELEIKGLDFDFEAALTDSFRLFGSANFLDAKFAKFPMAPFRYPNPSVCTPGGPNAGMTTGIHSGGFTECFGDGAGNKAPLSPKFAGSLGASYTIPVGTTSEVKLTVMYSYNDGYYLAPDNIERQDSFETVNATAELYANENWGVTFWGRNLTNELRYAHKSTAFSFFSVPADPRTYGITLNYNY